jgi:hypothetical protein
MEALTQGPILVLVEHISPLYLAAVFKVKGIGCFALHQEGSLMGGGHMGHQLRVTAPTICPHQGGRPDEAPSTQGRQALIEHDLSPRQVGTAPPPRPGGVRPPHGKVDGHAQLAVADAHPQQPPINPVYHTLVLPAPPRADELQLVAILPKD